MIINVFHQGVKRQTLEVDNMELSNGSEIFIGRAQDCHIVLDDKQVSRNHASIFYENDTFKLRKDSNWGDVIHSGRFVEKSSDINENDRVEIGDFSLVISQLAQKETNSDNLDQTSLNEITASEHGLDEEVSLEATAIIDDLEAADKHVDEESEGDELGDYPQHQDDEISGDSEVEEENAFFDDESSEAYEDSQDNAQDGFSADDGFDDENAFSSEDGFGHDASGVGESTQVFKSFAKYYLEIDGEYAPFDRFQIEDKDIIIGRDAQKAQIVLNDPEVSSEHARIRKTLVNCFIEDLNSSNGTILNGNRINKEELSNNDRFEIGSTLFTVKVVSELLENESERLMPVEDGQEVEVEEVVEEEVDFDELGDSGEEFDSVQVEEKSLVKRIMKDPKKRMIAIVAILLLVLVLFDEEDPKTPGGDKAADQKKKDEAIKEESSVATQKKNLSPDVVAKLEENYVLALSKYEEGEYYEAKEYLDVVRSIDPNYKDTQTLSSLIQEGYDELLKLKAEEEAEKERKKRQLLISGLLEKAKKAVEKREVKVAQSLFAQILELDPENIEVSPLRLEIEAYEDQKKREREEEARKRALRQAMVDALQPGKTLYIKEEWYQAILELEKFTMKEGMDEDLMREAAQMLKDAKNKLGSLVDPLLGRARAYKDGQDLKRAYETYGQVLKYEPSNEEALNEREAIFSSLRSRSMRIYREALISESLSLFDEAKEKFEEVQQVSPIGSEYYEKATEKLKKYPE